MSVEIPAVIWDTALTKLLSLDKYAVCSDTLVDEGLYLKLSK